MLTELFGKKLQMTQLWNDAGEVVPVTVLQAGPCQVVQVKTEESSDGYRAAQIAFDAVSLGRNDMTAKKTPRVNAPRMGHFRTHSAEPAKMLGEVPLPEGVEVKPGDVITVSIFGSIKKVDISGKSKGRGFAGVIKRHNYSRGPKSHGSKHYRAPGSTGMHQGMSRVRKGKPMPGQYGAEATTAKNLEVIKVDVDRNLLYVKGAVPGPSGGYLRIRKSKTA